MVLTKTNREHSFDVELAEIHGIEKAVLLKNFDYWTRENERKQADQFFMGGRYWTAESISSLAKKYPYMKKTSIRRWVDEMHEGEWLEIVKRQSDVSFYRPGRVFELWNTGQEWQVRQNGATEKETHAAKMAQSLGQNGAIVGPKWRDNCAKMADNNIDYNVELDIDYNVEKGVSEFQNDFFPFVATPEQTPPPSSAVPPHFNAFNNQAAFTVATYEQAETPTGPVLIEMHGEATRVPLATQTPKAKSKKAPAEITPEQIAAHLQPNEQGFFAQVIANGAWADYQEYRMGLDRFRYKDAKSAAAGIRGMFTATAGNADNAQTVIDQSRANGWKGVFPLKNNNNARQQYQSGGNTTSDFYGGAPGSFTGGIRRD